jgi:molybdopterin converting factor small subunit
MIRVKVYAPSWCDIEVLDERGWIDLPEGSTLADVLKQIKMPKFAAKVLLAAVNSEKKPLDTVLEDGDMVSFFAMMAGG